MTLAALCTLSTLLLMLAGINLGSTCILEGLATLIWHSFMCSGGIYKEPMGCELSCDISIITTGPGMHASIMLSQQRKRDHG